MIWILLGLCVALYFIGGQKWAHSLFRDVGSTLCIYGIASILFGWNWLYIPAAVVTGLGLGIGDHEEWQWSIHGFVVSLGMCVISIWAGLVVAVISALLTYLTSKFLSKGGIDVICRGLIYGSLPLGVFWLLKLAHLLHLLS